MVWQCKSKVLAKFELECLLLISIQNSKSLVEMRTFHAGISGPKQNETGDTILTFLSFSLFIRRSTQTEWPS